MPQTPPPAVVSALEWLRRGLGNLQQKMVPPNIAMVEFVSGMWSFQIVYVMVELEIADALLDGPRSSDPMAAEKDVDAEALYRLLRAATNLNLVKELPQKSFELTALGRAMSNAQPYSSANFIKMMGRVGWEHWGGLLDCVKTGKTAIELQRDMAPFDFLAGDHEPADDFNRAMTAISEFSAPPAVAAYDFANKMVVDVGGGQGRLLAEILAESPGSTGVLFDLPHVVEGATEVLKRFRVQDRCERVGGSFFEADDIPSGGDVYIMRSIIHDWDDEDSVKILENVAHAMTNDAVLLLCEAVVPPPNKAHFSKLLDLEMLVHAGGKERTETEYRQLLQKAGFTLTRVIPTASPASLVEAERS